MRQDLILTFHIYTIFTSTFFSLVLYCGSAYCDFKRWEQPVVVSLGADGVPPVRASDPTPAPEAAAAGLTSSSSLSVVPQVDAVTIEP